MERMQKLMMARLSEDFKVYVDGVSSTRARDQVLETGASNQVVETMRKDNARAFETVSIE